MSVLLLRLAGPMQSWGTDSRFSHRDTRAEPSKSGVIGLLCAALGRPRSEPLADLAALKMGVRVDRRGRLAPDFHTAQEVVRADGSGRQDTVVSTRFYLADGDFLVGLEGERGLLTRLDAALRRPVWPLYLGRKAFVPGHTVPLPNPEQAIHEGTLEDILRTFPWFRRHKDDRPEGPLRYVIDVDFGTGEPRPDVPLSFEKRTFAVRHVKVDFFPQLPMIHDPEGAHVSEPTDPQHP
jgi:CRISPR system Cascade subunit CasD